MDDAEDELEAYCRKRVGATLQGKWQLDKMLGMGGMAAVYAASHRNGASAALKVLHPQYAAHSTIRERFLREAYIANKAGHEGAVQVRDDGIDENGAPFLIMELLLGESVADRADRLGGTVPLRDTLWIGHELLQVLVAAHKHGIVHRDIKPDNVFWTTDGKIKVLDFGIARLLEDAPPKKSRTRTGMVFGTPGYMAPEQALGRWTDVDARTDLWAVGATMFNLITGQSVHEGDSDEVRHINAATRPARSLGKVFPSAPHSVVEVIDRSLAFDQSQRYPDAESMRKDLARVTLETRGTLRAEVHPSNQPPSDRKSAQTLDASPAADAGAKGKPPPEASELLEVIEETSPGTILMLRELFALLEKSMKSRLQYGKGHKETERRVEVAFTHVAAALQASNEPIAWNVRAYGFTTGQKDELVWEPKPPLDQICYRLFSDGIRSFGIAPGLTQRELAELLRILVADESSEIAPEDNLATLLWDAKFDHIVYEEAETFAEGDQNDRVTFEKGRQAVLVVATLETPDQLEDCWRARGEKPSVDVATKQRALLGALSGVSSASAQAASMRGDSLTPRGELLAIDEATRAIMAARLDVNAESVGERFASAAAAAFVVASRHETPGLVGGPLRTSVDGFSGPTAVSDALAFVTLLTSGVDKLAADDERAEMTASLVNRLVSASTAAAIIKAAATSPDPESFVVPLRAILPKVDATHVAPAALAAAALAAGELRDGLLAYIAKHARGHEREVSPAFLAGNLDASLALLKILMALGTPEARAAAHEATKSPHPIVRIEALGHVEGLSGGGTRNALKGMLEEVDPAVRLAALRSIAEYRIKAAGPALVLRVKSPEFDGLPLEERREALITLFSLMSSRAEVVCIELLADTRIIANEVHEQTRALATEVLGQRGYSPDARVALETASRGRWRNSDVVRMAATTALAVFEERARRSSLPAPTSGRTSDAPKRDSSEPPARRSSVPAVASESLVAAASKKGSGPPERKS
jgi:serine/threonine protein kinase